MRGGFRGRVWGDECVERGGGLAKEGECAFVIDLGEGDFVAGRELAEEGQVDGGDVGDDGVAAGGGVVCAEDDG